VILTGTMGDHQAAVLIARNRLELSARILSDVAPLSSMLLGALSSFGEKVRFMRDPTRGGVGVSLNEMAEASGVRIVLDESRLPVAESVRGICEILGFDPLYLANEGKALLIVDGRAAVPIAESLRKTRYGKDAAVIGEVTEGTPGVIMKTAAGGMRAVDYPVGDQLPRIC
jgi:hydrogenase expression/formation protein HypE